MWKAENIFNGAIALLCTLYLFFTFQMRVGTIIDPGPGFVPAVLGISGLLVSILLFQNGLKNSSGKTENLPGDGILRFVGYLLTIIAFVPMFKYLGTIAALFFMVLSLTKISGSKGWILPVLLAAICSGTAYLLFYVALGVPLPSGIF